MEFQNYKLKVSEEASLKQVNDQWVFFCKNKGDFFGLNESAAALVNRLLQSDCRSVLNEMSKTWNVQLTELERDLEAVVVDLESKGMVTRVAS